MAVLSWFSSLPASAGVVDAANHAGHRELAAELTRQLRGEVRFTDGDRALYATDASNYRQVPIGVVCPADPEDAAAAVAICREFDAPVVHRGGGTSLAGQGCNHAVLIDFSKYANRILSIDAGARLARVEPGVVLDDLRAAAERVHLTFGPDPATHTHCTLGGMIGNNSCGVHSMMAGCTAENVHALDVLTYDGLRFEAGHLSESALEEAARGDGPRSRLFSRIRSFRTRYADAIRRGFPRIPRRVSGYDLPALFSGDGADIGRALVGSEGTLVTVLSATVKLVPSPPSRVLLVLGYPSVFEAADHIMEVRESRPIGLEGLDDVLVGDMKKKGLHPARLRLLPDGEGWLLVEFGADSRAEAEGQAHALMDRLRGRPDAPSMKLYDDPAEANIVWKIRESGLGATARVPGEHDTWEGWEDSSVAPEQLGKYLRDLRALMQRYHYRAALYGHFGQGCVHTRIPFDLSHPQGVATFRSFVEEAADLVVAHGGSLSGEHGDGQSRAELLPKMFGPELMQAFGEWKAMWDERNRMNPGKIVHAHRLDEDLRLGPGHAPGPVTTFFNYPDDRNQFGYAAERCVGVGECRRSGGGTMCPSYMVTREEQHSTRGRARLLFEMLRGETITDGWRNERVREALDLCLSCKGCKGECPVNVDMATYKAEFLAHYYAGRLRPPSAYAFGLLFRWARLGSLVPELANVVMRAPGLSRVLKTAVGIEPRRELPPLARVTFREWWRRRPERNAGRPRVLLWVDTWNNYWTPTVAAAAVDVIEDAGFRVCIPTARLCCGRPLYDYGMLGLARRLLVETLDALRPELRAGTPIVGLEPSCVSVFRDELVSLMPDDPDAARLRQQTFLLDDFLLHHAPGWRPPRLERRAIVHGHCHQKAVLGFEHAAALFDRLGVQTEVPDTGCCGMAGGFGYERGHYEVSVACAERVLAPTVRQAAPGTLVVADGFSCREQIQQQTGRRALHTAEVIAMATRAAAGTPRVVPSEDACDERLPVTWRENLRAVASLAAAAAALVWMTSMALGTRARRRTAPRARERRHRVDSGRQPTNRYGRPLS
jgi:FAD/FMN-containing dehydrogenase/Fe-S oxidoreductase